MTIPAAHAAEDSTYLAVRPKRVVRVAFVSQLVNELPAVLTVLAAGASAIGTERAGVGRAVAAAELLTGAWVLLTIAREARHRFGRGAHQGAREAPPSRVDVAGLAAAAMGYVEVWQHAVARGHFKLVSPFMLGATSSLIFALGGRAWIRERMHHRTRHRRPHLLVTAEAVTYRGGRRSGWTAPWADVEAVEHGPDALTVRLCDGSAHVLRAEDYVGGAGLLADAREAVAAHAPARLTSGGPADPLGAPR